MNALKTVASAAVVALAVLVTGCQTNPGEPQVTEQMKQDCFNAHKQLMDKPAVKTMDACWRAHGYKMMDAHSSTP